MNRRRLVSYVLYCCYLAVAVTGICYAVFFRPWINKLHDLRQPNEYALSARRHVSPDTLALVGWLHTPREGSFTTAEMLKPPDTVRVCAFGDSLTYGDEVGPGHDYPAFVARDLARDFDNIEVLNFGTSWWGFHQTYLLWERTGQQFDCDYVLLGPRTFYPPRDTSFNHTGVFSPYRLHARYVLDGDGVTLVELEGSTYQERFDHYFRFLQPWRFLRYDRMPPTVLRSMIPSGKRISNPFYYSRRSMVDEAYATYERLLENMASTVHGSGGNVIVGLYDNDLEPRLQALSCDSLSVFEAERPMSFPFLAPRGHNSSFGNAYLAHQYANEVRKAEARADSGARARSRPPTNIREVSNDITSQQWVTTTPPEMLRQWQPSKPHSLESRLQSMTIEHENVSLAVLAEPGYLPKTSPNLLPGDEAKILVGFKNSNMSAADAVYVTMPMPEAGAIVRLQAVRDGDTISLDLGRLRSIGDSAIAVVDIEAVRIDPVKAAILVQDDETIGAYSVDEIDEIIVEIGGRVVARGERQDSELVLAPIAQPVYRFRVPKGGHVDPSVLHSSPDLTLVLEFTDGRIQRMPCASIKRPPARTSTDPGEDLPIESAKPG